MSQRENTPSSPSLYVLRYIESDTMFHKVGSHLPIVEKIQITMRRPVRCGLVQTMGQRGRTTVRSYLTVNKAKWGHRECSQNDSLTPGSGVPSPMTVKQMKTSDVAAIRCSRVRVDSKGTALDAVPRGQITPFLEKVKMLL